MLTDLVYSKEHRRHNYIYTIFITVSYQVPSITNKFVPLQSGSLFYQRTKLTGTQYKHRVTKIILYCVFIVNLPELKLFVGSQMIKHELQQEGHVVC